MAEKPKPTDKRPITSEIRNGQIKDKPLVGKISILPPPPTKPKK